MKNFNINHNVKVKLTKVGLNELKLQHDNLREAVPSLGEFKPPTVDEDGYSTFQMWCLMSSLGHLCQMGFEQPFETEIILLK